MITCVRFPHPVQVLPNDPRGTWKPGQDSIAEIHSDDGAIVRFTMNPDGREVRVVAPPGTVIEMSAPKEANEPPGSAPLDGAAPARPIPKSGRVQR